MLKIYLGIQGGAVELEQEIYEYSLKLNIANGQFKETIRAPLAPQYIIDLFHCHFEQPFVYTRRCSLMMESFLALILLFMRRSLLGRGRGQRRSIVFSLKIYFL